MDRQATRVILADDHAMVRESLARVLQDTGSIVVLGQAENGRALIEITRTHQPDCVVIDYSMPEMDGPEAIARLVEEFPQLKILVLTVHENVHYAVRALEVGAHGYMIKSAAVDELVDAIATVSRGDLYVSPKVRAEVWARLRQPRRARQGLDALSQREFDVLKNFAQGVSLQECAARMHVSTSTVSTYRSRLLEKLNLKSTAELIRFALEHGLGG